MMRKSLLYKMTQFGYKPDVKLDPKRFTHVFTSKYGKVRIFKVERVSQKSKRWVANPKNRKCDAPGSWYCEGQYPPALNKTIAKRKNFKQLEDFNVKGDEKAAKYYEEYMKKMERDGKRDEKPVSRRTPSDDADATFVGCYGYESSFIDKEYFGGASGASYSVAYENTKMTGKKYFAVAR